MTTQTTNQPADTIRDGALKVTIWKNFGENGTFYSVEPSRTYKQGEAYKDSHSLSGTEPIQMARLLHLAYTRIGELIQQDRTPGTTNATDQEAA
mgnify:CR=1 FL=1